jgi:2-polyprenyl-6-hydroxyphenyl methylase/3-demethylubiquinone-9 3-methyltransferase
MWARAGKPKRWTVEHAVVLDNQYLGSLGQFDIVYSWSVFHRTNEMWNAGNGLQGIIANFALKAQAIEESSCLERKD